MVTVGRLSIVRTLVGVLLVGSGALAQQGLVVDPWHKAAKPVAVPLPPLRALPASGLPPPSAALPALPALPAPRQAEAPPAAAPAAVAKWSPPVVELLVDPWAKSEAAAAPKPRWSPKTLEIIDPWADAAAPSPPRIASRPAESGRSTIF
jgi:hypothetical protein